MGDQFQQVVSRPDQGAVVAHPSSRDRTKEERPFTECETQPWEPLAINLLMQTEPQARQYLACRIAPQDTMERRIACWLEQRNAAAAKIDWQFTTADARIKLKSLYPSL